MADRDHANEILMALLYEAARSVEGLPRRAMPRGTCWWCGAEMDAVEVTTMGDVEPRYLWMPRGTPGGADHACAVVPPSPGELLAAGADTYDRIIAISAE
jgi:hypothetical protein